MTLKGKNNLSSWFAISCIVGVSLFSISDATAGSVVRSRVAKICSQTPTLNQQTLQSARGSECGAAKDQLNARNSNTAGSVVWAAVTTVCTYDCAKGGAGTRCTFASKAATAVQEGLSKNFSAALTPLQDAKIKTAANANIAKETTENTSKTSQSCLAAATSGLSSFQKAGNAGKSREEITSLYHESAKLDGSDGNGGKNAPAIANTTPGAQDQSELKGPKNTPDEIPGENKLCREENLKTAVGALACAAKTDPNLPPYVKSGEFLKDLEKVTGKPADDFFKDFKDPAHAIAGGVGGSLDTKQAEGLLQVLSALDKATGASKMGEDSPSLLAAGGGLHSANSEPELDINALMQKMLGENGAEEKQNGGENGEPQAEGFKAAERRLASITAENSKVSIFDRVKWRYLVIDQKQGLGGLGGAK